MIVVFHMPCIANYFEYERLLSLSDHLQVNNKDRKLINYC